VFATKEDVGLDQGQLVKQPQMSSVHVMRAESIQAIGCSSGMRRCVKTDTAASVQWNVTRQTVHGVRIVVCAVVITLNM